MSYIDQNLLPGEQIIFRTKKSLMLFSRPILLTLAVAYFSRYMLANPVLVKLLFAPWLLVLLSWAYMGIEFLSSNYAVTDKRVMLREGFFTRHTNEMRLTAISQVNVEQSLLGQLFNYGTVSINAFGAFDAFPLIDHPVQFQQSVNQQLDLLVK